MAKIQVEGGFPLHGVSGGYLLVTNGHGVTGMQLANNNRKNIRGGKKGRGSPTTAKFQNIDSNITNLDSLFDQSTSQDAWNDYADTIEGEWQLCANCQPESIGKKLYRQYNFNRRLLGLSVADVPIDGTECAEQGSLYVVWHGYGDGTPTSVTWEVSGVPSTCYLNPSAGMSGKIPLFFNNAYAGGTYYAESPVFTWINSVVAAVYGVPPPSSEPIIGLQCCTFTANGAPGITVTIPIEVRFTP